MKKHTLFSLNSLPLSYECVASRSNLCTGNTMAFTIGRADVVSPPIGFLLCLESPFSQKTHTDVARPMMIPRRRPVCTMHICTTKDLIPANIVVLSATDGAGLYCVGLTGKHQAAVGKLAHLVLQPLLQVNIALTVLRPMCLLYSLSCALRCCDSSHNEAVVFFSFFSSVLGFLSSLRSFFFLCFFVTMFFTPDRGHTMTR